MCTCSSISTDQELRQGDVLFSDNKDFKAVFQTDSNFVVYGWTPIWASNTQSKDGYRIILQQDGNLVMYTKATDGQNQKPIWATDTYTPNAEYRRMRLTLANSGLLELDNDGKETWSSKKN